LFGITNFSHIFYVDIESTSADAPNRTPSLILLH